MSSARYTAMRRVRTQAQDKKVQIDTRLALNNNLVSAVGCSLNYDPIFWKPKCPCNKAVSRPHLYCPPLNLLDYGTLLGDTFTLTTPLTVLECQRLVIPYIFYNNSIFFENSGTIIFNNLLFTNGNFFNYGDMTFNGNVRVGRFLRPPVIPSFFSNRGGNIINNATLSSDIIGDLFFFNSAGGIFNNTNGTIDNLDIGIGSGGFANPNSTVCGGIVNGFPIAGYTLSC